jgi:hypothetical protein
MNDETGDLDDTMQVRCLDLPPAQSVWIVDDDDLVLARLRDRVTAAGLEWRWRPDEP